MNAEAKILEFWYEFASTYSYLSAMRIEKLAKQRHVKIIYKPFLLGPIFREQGWNDSPFNIYPAKGKYMWKDLERKCQKYGIPLRRPSQFPRNGLLAARIALLGNRQDWGPEFSRQVYHAEFAKDLNIGDSSVLRGILKEIGRDPEEVLEAAQSEEIKTSLKVQTERAKTLGIFGAPSFIVKDELFWGDDRLEDALERATLPV
jgi:2-hydroxychromene-2-carboxylate isomerase